MKFLGPRLHGYIDFVLIACFVVGPLAFGLGGTPALISLALAGLLLILALLTRYPLGLVRRIPLFVHGLFELAVTIFVAVLPRIDGYAPGSPARRFYWAMAIVLATVWVLTDYREPLLDAAPPRSPSRSIAG